MAYRVQPLEKLVEQFERLPGIGKKTAGRLAYHILSRSDDEAKNFADAILEAKEKIHYCKCCQNLTDLELCPVCTDDERDKSSICVVEDPRDVMAFERTREYNGLYHVLHGVLSPLNGITPDKLRLKELLERVKDGEVKEVIVATNADVEGETTAMYIARLLRPLDIKVTRLAFGISVGTDIEYTDEVTLFRALQGRRDV